eukprot:TRINITY_DN2681_c0_g1_i2.p1 TRINITY_DN2681_c0_g1~~TRINITY_DN2681_c0_g1_i2.p1  ORF type:complete len:1206 (+),score=280.58 TRINITY_DN2681_c0_g1_i2:65-3682(+)
MGLRAGLGRCRACLPRRNCLGSRRSQVSVATLLERTDNVLPCYAILQHQLRPQIEEEPSRCQTTPNFVHSIKWSWDGKEVTHQGTHRSKRGAKNEAARDLLKRLAAEEAQLMDPGKNGALAQWAIECINERLDASMELQEEVEAAEGQGEAHAMPRQRSRSHTCTWSCPQVSGETVASGGSAPVAAESRRQAMAALYRSLPQNLEELYLSMATQRAAQPGSAQASSSASQERALFSEINVMHNAVTQKLGVQASTKFSKPMPDGQIECTLQWSFYDQQSQSLKTETAVGVGRSKAVAKGRANEQMLIAQGHMPALTEESRAEIEDVRKALQANKVREAAEGALALMDKSAPDSSSWSLFLPQVLRAVLAEGDSVMLHELLAGALRGVQEKGAPIELWEALLDEASFAIRHYFMATSALEQLTNFPLADAFPGPLEKEYFRKFRSLLALERHGSLMQGIQEYELDPHAQCSVPTVEVHNKEASMVVLTSAPGAAMMELVEGARALRASDIVLLVPSEAADERAGADHFGEIGNTSGWQHPEAWLASVTSVVGNPRFGEEVRLHTRRISRFSSDVEGPEASAEDDGKPRLSPITLGRQFRLFYVAMETPLCRQFSALRCLSQVHLPAWSEGFEGRKATYNYGEAIRQLMMAEPDSAQSLAQEPARGGMTEDIARSAIQNLAAQRPWVGALTESQQMAVSKAMQQRLSLIQGPPGTGKTFVACAVIAAWAQTFSPLGERILAVADSNVAADNLHHRLQGFGIESVRVGQGKEADSRPGDMRWKEAQTARVVVATCIGSGMDILNSKSSEGFQRVIVDECTQACEPAVLVPLGRRCEQVVLIGDHAQLPATVLSKAAQREGLGISLFERMVNTNGLSTTLLTEQRRMHSSIADFPNQAFYAGQLVNAADDASLTAVPGFPWPNPDCRVAFVDVSPAGNVEGRRGFSAFNTAEAESVATALDRILRAGYPARQIVVLTAYLAQKQEIIRAIRDRGMGQFLDVISVDTVDGYQGMEQGLVLFSATRNNESRALGFLSDNRRMNVMLTRAKQGLIIFGNSDTLRYSESMMSRWPAWLDWVEERGAMLTSEQLQAAPAQAQVQAQPQAQPQVQAAQPLSEPQAVGQRPAQAWDELGMGDLSERASASSTPVSQGSATTSPSPGGFPPPPSTPTAPPSIVWQQVYSEEYRAHYYWNKATNATQWEAPESFLPAA